MKGHLIDVAKRIAIATAIGVASHYAVKAIVAHEQKTKQRR
ncbi:hypothetical protein [Pseudomonas phage D6]|nr:hypothetical protein [Pseudomonas phage D6]